MFVDSFISSLETNQYNTLINNEIVDEVRALEESQNAPSAILLENNLTNNTHKVVFITFPDNGHFDVSTLYSEIFQKKAQTVLDVYEDKIQIEKGYSFNTLNLENSYDEDLTIRKEVKLAFDAWSPYYKRFLDSCFNCFDGESDNYLNGLYSSTNKLYNRLICHEYPDAQFDRDKNIIEQLCELYKITETNQDKFDLNEIIHKLQPILAKENLKLNYRLIQSKNQFQEFEIMIYPMVHDARNDIFYFTLDHLKNIELLNFTVVEELKNWESDRRKFGHISLKIIKQDRIRLEVLASYGVF
jgi:hypothetical protein